MQGEHKTGRRTAFIRRLRDGKRRVAVPRASGANPSGAQAARVRPPAAHPPLPIACRSKPWLPSSGAWPTRSVGSPAGPPPAFGGVGSAGHGQTKLDAWMLFILECLESVHSCVEECLGSPKIQRQPALNILYCIVRTEYRVVYRCTTHRDSSSAYVPGRAQSMRYWRRSKFQVLHSGRRGAKRSATRLVSAGARIGAPWKRLDDDESRPQGPQGPARDMQFCEGNEPPFRWLWLALAGPDGPRLTFIDDPGPNATRFLQMEVVGSQGGLQSGFRAGYWHAAGLLAPWGGCRVSPGFPGTARECASERQRAPECASPFDSSLRSASLGFVAPRAGQQTRSRLGSSLPAFRAFRAHLPIHPQLPSPSKCRTPLFCVLT